MSIILSLHSEHVHALADSGPTSSITVLVLGAALAGVFIALVISCILNIVIHTWSKQVALSKVPAGELKEATQVSKISRHYYKNKVNMHACMI